MSTPNISQLALKTDFVDADGVKIFYTHAGPANGPVLLLLHGFPTGSYMYRTLMPLLAHKYRVIAPDIPGFGFTVVPAERKYEYTFQNFGKSIEAFVDALGLTKFALYVFDYGAPTGFYLALSKPDSITHLITQNGNAYTDGLGPAWAPVKAYWADHSQANADALRPAFTLEGLSTQYTTGVPPALLPRLNPLGWTLDAALINGAPGGVERQIEIFYDYRNNIESYPRFQAWLREKQPKVLAVWGNGDEFFVPAGAEAYKGDVTGAKVVMFETGHFALETHVDEIAKEILAFLP